MLFNRQPLFTQTFVKPDTIRTIPGETYDAVKDIVPQGAGEIVFFSPDLTLSGWEMSEGRARELEPIVRPLLEDFVSHPLVQGKYDASNDLAVRVERVGVLPGHQRMFTRPNVARWHWDGLGALVYDDLPATFLLGELAVPQRVAKGVSLDKSIQWLARKHPSQETPGLPEGFSTYVPNNRDQNLIHPNTPHQSSFNTTGKVVDSTLIALLPNFRDARKK